MTNKQPPWRTILPHTIMAVPLVKKFLAFWKTWKPTGWWQL